MICCRRHLLAFGTALALLFLLEACSKKVALPQMPPAEVLVTLAKPEDVTIFQEFVATLEGSVNASIQPRVSGYLVEQNYKEGTALKKGDLMFTIDSRPFKVASAKARAALVQAEASARQASLLAGRNEDLLKRKVVSEQDRDNAVQTSLAAQAVVDAQRAALEQADLDLEFTRVTAPVDGVAGIAQAQVGDLVGPSTGVFTTISTVDPIKAYFTVNEQAYVEYRSRYADATGRAEHEKQLHLELVLSDGSLYPEKGVLFATDREVDVRTGAIRVAATFPNPTGALRPGQFARVRVRAESRHGALLVPQRAVTENRASVRPVKLGPRLGSRWIVENGLKAGEQVVVEGILKLHDGAPVAPKPWTALAPPAEAKPETAAANR
jgi:RND family efflux transporter MFP subunit